jgi:hypothetical protein
LDIFEGPHSLVFAQFPITAIAIDTRLGHLHSGPEWLAIALLVAAGITLVLPFIHREFPPRPYFSVSLVVWGLAVHWPGAAVWVGAIALLLSIGYEIQLFKMLKSIPQASHFGVTQESNGNAVLIAALASSAALTLPFYLFFGLGASDKDLFVAAVCTTLIVGGIMAFRLAAAGWGGIIIAPFRLLGALPIYGWVLKRTSLGRIWAREGNQVIEHEQNGSSQTGT